MDADECVCGHERADHETGLLEACRVCECPFFELTDEED